MRAPLIGLSTGILLDIVLWLSGPFAYNSGLLKLLYIVSTPVAYIISWITGWTLHQEEGMLVYLFAIPITIPLLGLLAGLAYSGIKSMLNPSIGSSDH